MILKGSLDLLFSYSQMYPSYNPEDLLISRTFTYIEDAITTSIYSSMFFDCVSLQSVNFPACITIGNVAFYNCTSLQSVNFPVCTVIGTWAFEGCTSLQSVNFPACTTIGVEAFENCTLLQSINFPACITINKSAFCSCSSLQIINFSTCTTINKSAFYRCYTLQTASFPACTFIDDYAFSGCSKLSAIYLLASSVCKLSNANAFLSTPMSLSTYLGYFGSIYVPSSLVDVYKNATNWTYYKSRITSYIE